MLKLNGLLICLIATIGISGCGGGPADPDRPDLTKVTGTVSYKSAPVEGATVAYANETIGGKPAFGITDVNGKFSLTTFEDADGAIPGPYKVTITKMEKVISKALPTDDPKYDPNYVDPPAKSLLPDKYAQVSTSGLSATVGQEPMTDVKFDLVD